MTQDVNGQNYDKFYYAYEYFDAAKTISNPDYINPTFSNINPLTQGPNAYAASTFIADPDFMANFIYPTMQNASLDAASKQAVVNYYMRAMEHPDITAPDGAPNFIVGTDNNDNPLDGTANNDFIVARDGTDLINANAGNDFVDGGKGADYIDGGAGDDYLFGGELGDTLIGGDNSDHLYGEEDGDYLYGNAGTDYLYGGAGNDTLWIDMGEDLYSGGADADTFQFNLSSINNQSNPAQGMNTITDFNASEGDVLDITNILSGYDPLNDDIADFVSLSDDGTNSFLAVDQDGLDTSYSFITVAQLNGVTNLDLNDMITNGELLVA